MPVHVSVYFVGMAALCLAAGPARRIGLGLAFAALHELGHLAAMAAMRLRPGRVCLTAAGMRIERPPGLQISFAREIAIALAGPAVSLLLAGAFHALHRAFPSLLSPDPFLLNLGFGLFNLLPVRQLDGGRALYFLLCTRVSEPTAGRLVTAASLLCLFFAAGGAALLCLRRGFSLSLVIAVLYLAAGC
ncbi:MAG: hypothetical protein FWC27_07095 [Firmicutes bacterium]|nr:hypothetical protein [Bacillota bacterium]